MAIWSTKSKSLGQDLWRIHTSKDPPANTAREFRLSGGDLDFPINKRGGYFYQTSLGGFHPDWGGWHISAGSTNPQLECDLACPPFKLNGQIFRPKPNTVYELGVRLIPQASTNKVHLYFVDFSTNMLYNIHVLDDSGNVSTPIGGILEAYTVNPSKLSELGGSNAFRIVNANWLIEPWASTRWPHGDVYEAKGDGYETTPPKTFRLSC